MRTHQRPRRVPSGLAPAAASQPSSVELKQALARLTLMQTHAQQLLRGGLTSQGAYAAKKALEAAGRLLTDTSLPLEPTLRRQVEARANSIDKLTRFDANKSLLSRNTVADGPAQLRSATGEMNQAQRKALSLSKHDDKSGARAAARRAIELGAQVLALGHEHLSEEAQHALCDRLEALQSLYRPLKRFVATPTPNLTSSTQAGRAKDPHKLAPAKPSPSSASLNSNGMAVPSWTEVLAQGDALSRELRYAYAKTLRQSPEEPPSKEKLKLDGPRMTEAMGTLAMLRGDKLEQVPFRVSYLRGPVDGDDFLLGSSLGAANHAKVRPALVLASDGSAKEILFDELRLEPVANVADKSLTNRLDQARNEGVATPAIIPDIVATLHRCGGPIAIGPVTFADNKVYIGRSRTDGSLLQAAMAASPANKGPLARITLASLLLHYQHLRDENIILIDGALENSSLTLATGQATFGNFASMRDLNDPDAMPSMMRPSFASPELDHEFTTVDEPSEVSFAHDIWTLGISALRMLGPDIIDPKDLASWRRVGVLRNEALPLIGLGDDTPMPLEEMRLRQSDFNRPMRYAHTIFGRDEELARFALSRMLEPDPSKRATIEECIEVFARLTAPYAGQSAAIMADVSKTISQTQQAFDKLHLAHDLLEGRRTPNT